MPFKVFFGIFESLFAKRHLPLLVIQTFVEFLVGRFSDIWICIGSIGSPSFTQIKTS